MPHSLFTGVSQLKFQGRGTFKAEGLEMKVEMWGWGEGRGNRKKTIVLIVNALENQKQSMSGERLRNDQSRNA